MYICFPPLGPAPDLGADAADVQPREEPAGARPEVEGVLRRGASQGLYILQYSSIVYYSIVYVVTGD